jgi:hypothetical protein
LKGFVPFYRITATKMIRCEGRVSKEKKKLIHKAGQCPNPAFLQFCTDENDDESATWLCKKCAKNNLNNMSEWFGVFDDGKLPPNMLSERDWLKRFG